MVIKFNHQLFLRSNLFYGFCKYHTLHDVFFLLVCSFLAKSKIFLFSWSVNFVVLSVCLLPTGHNFKPIFTKLHHLVEFVIRKKPVVFEVKRSTWPNSKIVNFHPIHLMFEEDLHYRSLNSTTNYF